MADLVAHFSALLATCAQTRIERRQDKQCQRRRADEATDNDCGERLLNLAAGSGCEKHRDQTKSGDAGRNQDRAQPQDRAFDPAGERLFVCALGNNTVEVIDLKKGARVHSITGLSAPQGIACVPEPGRIYAANDKGGVCKIYDAGSYQLVGEIDFKDDADNVRYDDASKSV